MPSYQYVCPTCGESRSIFKSMAESGREEKCETKDCDSILQRDFMGQDSTFILQGSGWTGKIRKRGRGR